MLTQAETMTFEATVQAEPGEVFRAFTAPSALRDWLCDAAQVEPRKGGRVYLWWNKGYHTAGIFTEFHKGESLAFTWQGLGDPAPTEVRVTLDKQSMGTGITVIHNGLGSDAAWAESAARIRQIWEAGLENLQSVLETGVDLRFARRPMFGLNGGDVMNEEIAARLGVPVKEGIWLGGVVESMGAYAAGIRKDDVIVSLAEHDITTFQSFTAALQNHQAGDRVPVVFYRGPERHTVTIELSRRPMPELPTTANELAEQVRTKYNTLDAELEQCFEGVSEAQADYRLAPSEWNAKEVMAHLIAVERDLQTWMAAIVEDEDLENVFHTNEITRLRALVSVYSTVPALLEELKRSEVETAALIAMLPPQTVQRKHLFNQIGNWVATFQDHHREHFGEIRKLVNMFGLSPNE